jgi:K(+)-stimulated pyrophosphate-energized sodium pump
MGLVIVALMGAAYLVSNAGLGATMADGKPLMLAPAVFAFGLVAFGFLGMGPVTIAVDSYGPVTDNAQSVYELSLIESLPNVKKEVKKEFGFDIDFEKAKEFLEENDGAGNTFKATAKPVLIGTAVVGSTTIFSIIMALTRSHRKPLQPRCCTPLPPRPHHGWRGDHGSPAPRSGGGDRRLPRRRVHQGQHQARRRREGVYCGLKKVVEICTSTRSAYFSISSSSSLDPRLRLRQPYFFIGYLISIALFGLFQAVFMANAGGAWDNAKKVVETELHMKNTPLHEATVVGDTVGDPFKDTSSVAMNPIIKFTTLFGLLAVELSVSLAAEAPQANRLLALACFLASTVFVYRSFYHMRIKSSDSIALNAAELTSARDRARG